MINYEPLSMRDIQISLIFLVILEKTMRVELTRSISTFL